MGMGQFGVESIGGGAVCVRVCVCVYGWTVGGWDSGGGAACVRVCVNLCLYMCVHTHTCMTCLVPTGATTHS